MENWQKTNGLLRQNCLLVHIITLFILVNGELAKKEIDLPVFITIFILVNGELAKKRNGKGIYLFARYIYWYNKIIVTVKVGKSGLKVIDFFAR